jgi:uncharacterized protein (DUF2147 family)
MSKRHFLPAVLVVCMIVPMDAAVAATTAQPTGEWVVADGSARIHIKPCRDALWGVIAWVKTPGTDRNNPDPALRNRSVVGMPILLDLKRTQANRWEGEVYNAKNGRTYSANISLVSADVLRIEGCVFGGLFCGGENWTRQAARNTSPSAKAPLPNNICP